MDELTSWIILAIGGLVAGVINTLAGGGSLLTVPLLVFMGLPATTANGTNRIGVLFQNIVSTSRFRKEGLDGIREAMPILLPVVIGSVLGAMVASQDGGTGAIVPDEVEAFMASGPERVG